jgi:hypothetical protein
LGPRAGRIRRYRSPAVSLSAIGLWGLSPYRRLPIGPEVGEPSRSAAVGVVAVAL